jgi:hypothetical protein
VLPVFRDDLVVAPDAMMPCNSQVQVIVFRARDGSLEATKRSDDLGPEHHRSRHPDEVVCEEDPIVVALNHRLLPCVPLDTILTDEYATASDQGGLRMIRKLLQGDFERSRQKPIVGVEKHHVVGSDMSETLIASGALTAIGLRQALNGIVAGGDLDGVVH